MPNATYNRALTGKKQCINNEFHELLMHVQATVTVLIQSLQDDSAKQPYLPLSGHSTTNWWRATFLCLRYLTFVLLRHHVV